MSQAVRRDTFRPRPVWRGLLPGLPGVRLRAAALLTVILGTGPFPGPFCAPARAAAPPAAADSSADPALVCARSKILLFKRIPAYTPEPTANQLRYDVRAYDLGFVLVPSAPLLEGTAVVTAQVTDGPLDSLQLDLADPLTVSAVSSAGADPAPLDFAHEEDLLTVRLDRSYAPGELVRIKVEYQGVPVGGAFNFDRQNGRPVVWTLSEPYGAHTWWPCKDHPEDKADSVDIRVQAPAGFRVASNGSLREERDDGVTSFAWWHESYPIASYLVSLGATSYRVYSDWYHPAAPGGASDSMEIRFYNYPANAADWEPVQSRVKLMIAGFAGDFGEYPFLREKYGHAQFNWPGGMEHQTITSLGGGISDGLAAHELSHQWWGDMVTCRDFHHIWLNEGFASYAEALWQENRAGEAGYRRIMERDAWYGPGTVYVPDARDEGRIFDSNLSYHKGAWVLHMLRHVVGDTAFFDLLREYGRRYRGGTATTEDFQAVAEEISGRSLGDFFREWVYGEGTPIYASSWGARPEGSGWRLEVRIRQTQSGPVFHMPIDLLVLTSAGDTTLVADNASADTTCTFRLPREPLGLVLDPGHWILDHVLPPASLVTGERPLLLVNSCFWQSDGADRLRSSYARRAFTGGYDFDFWDTHAAPAGGYPENLPPPLGHGPPTASVLDLYRTVVWVARTDSASWRASPLYSYLEGGGNVLLFSAQTEGFLTTPFADYLGVDPAGLHPVRRYRSGLIGLPDLPTLDDSSLAPAFSMVVNPGTILLYDTPLPDGSSAGLGALVEPSTGRFGYLGGRPEFFDPDTLRAATDFLLAGYFLKGLPQPAASEMLAPRPNPAREEASVRFFLPHGGDARIGVYDAAGRQVRWLGDRRLPDGWNSASWDGADDAGHPAASGVYFLRLQAPGLRRTARIVLVH